MFLQVSVCPQGGGVLSQYTLQVVSQHALQQVSGGGYPSMPCRFPGPHPRGKFRGICPVGGLQARTQGGSWGGSGPGPQPRGKLRGIQSRPTAKGEIEGDQPGGCLLLGGCLLQGGACSGGGVGVKTPPPPADGYCCGWYASYWNAFLFSIVTMVVDPESLRYR